MNFQSLGTQAAAGTHAASLNFDKAVSIGTAQRIDFSKDNPGVTDIRVELFWESNHDGDVAALVLGENDTALPGLLAESLRKNRSVSPGTYYPTRGMAWYNCYDIQGVSHSGDVQSTNGDNTAPEETIKINLSGLDPEAKTALIVASTFPSKEDSSKAVPFGKLRNCKVLVINNANNAVLYTYELDEDFSEFTSVELAKFYLRNGEWKFTIMGEGVGKSAQALSDIATKYGVK
jgi:stress response protein SCP2